LKDIRIQIRLVRGMDLRIRIRANMSRIRNIATIFLHLLVLKLSFSRFNTLFKGGFFKIYFDQYCIICSPSDTSVSKDAGIEPRTVATLALLAVRRSNYSTRSSGVVDEIYPSFKTLRFCISSLNLDLEDVFDERDWDCLG
jgi:hypothetical protein